MILWAILICLTISLANLFLQVRPRLRNRYFGIDTWRHLMVTDYVRRHKKLPTTLDEKYLIHAPSDYPPVLRILLALFPKKWLEDNQWLVSPLIDMLHNSFLFAVVYALTGHLFYAALAQTIYCLSPLVAMESSSLTTRSLASLLCSLAMVPMLAYPIWTNPLLYAIALFFMALLFLTHRMALQAMFMLFVVWSIVDRSWYYIGTFFMAMAVATIVSGGLYLKVLRGHLSMFAYWRANRRNRFAHQIRGIPKSGRKNPDPVFRLYELTERIPILPVLIANPWSLIAALMPVVQMIRGPMNTLDIPAEYYVKLWQWSTMLLCIGLSVRVIPALRFIGEGERYLEYASFPTSLIVSVMLINALAGPAAGWAALAAALIAIGGCLIPLLVVQQRVVIGDIDRSVTPELRKIFDVINQMPGEVRLASIPLYLISAAEYFTKSRVLSTDSGVAHVTHLSEFFPVLQKPFAEILARYGVNYLLVSERYVSLGELKLKDATVLCQSGNFCLLAIAHAPSALEAAPSSAVTAEDRIR